MSDEAVTADVIRGLRQGYASGPPRITAGACEVPERIWQAVEGTPDPARVGTRGRSRRLE